jgi:hypothetical protein
VSTQQQKAAVSTQQQKDAVSTQQQKDAVSTQQQKDAVSTPPPVTRSLKMFSFTMAQSEVSNTKS